jgi:hypothetical protein
VDVNLALAVLAAAAAEHKQLVQAETQRPDTTVLLAPAAEQAEVHLT